ncbi:VOC family protein [Chelativorans sp. AA-79]|uniref:VOC family protein n=1 Tax=Chelativorans sp. AA-79 TaxID=3028735 RepID=UPI0023F84E10|nr:VOC family protein [Chelativorans sp. AA-79]WEX11657.1 VOC family protein [Chelativorans sp. AA-79]
MTELPFAATTPISVAAVGLTSRDSEALARYYRDVVGLHELSRGSGAIVLGAGERPLLTIEQYASAKPDDTREAGLFHTAFLLPSRAALARWTRYAMERRIGIDGASDHLVSEAIYLNDPEGNGIEIYADRPRERWQWENGEIAMKTLRLDFRDLLEAAGDETWNGVPDGTVIGHVHLRVGDPAEAETWWHEALGLETMARYGPSAVFLASGGYHHHVGANAWHSAGAERRDPARAGLSWVTFNDTRAPGERTLEDPWGTVIRISPRSS